MKTVYAGGAVSRTRPFMQGGGYGILFILYMNKLPGPVALKIPLIPCNSTVSATPHARPWGSQSVSQDPSIPLEFYSEIGPGILYIWNMYKMILTPGAVCILYIFYMYEMPGRILLRILQEFATSAVRSLKTQGLGWAAAQIVFSMQNDAQMGCHRSIPCRAERGARSAPAFVQEGESGRRPRAEK